MCYNSYRNTQITTMAEKFQPSPDDGKEQVGDEAKKKLEDMKESVEEQLDVLIEECGKRFPEMKNLRRTKEASLEFTYGQHEVTAQLAQGLELMSIELLGKRLQFSSFPITANKFHRVLDNTITTVTQVNVFEKESGGKVTDMVAEDGYRIRFSTTKGDAQETYVATPRSILKVVRPRGSFFTFEDEKKVAQLKSELQKLKDESAKQKPPAFDYLEEKWRTVAQRGWREKKFDDEIRGLRIKIENLEDKKQTRLLQRKDGTVITEAKRGYGEGFKREYKVDDAIVEQTYSMSDDSVPRLWLEKEERKKDSYKKQSEYNQQEQLVEVEEEKGAKATVDHFAGGRLYLRRTLEGKWPSRKETQRLYAYEEDGKQKFLDPYSKMQQRVDEFEKKMKELTDSREFILAKDKERSEMYYKKQDELKKMLETEAVKDAEAVIQHLKTKEDYDLFEEVFILPGMPSPYKEFLGRVNYEPLDHQKYECLKQIRLHGRRLYGLDTVMDEWERRNPEHNLEEELFTEYQGVIGDEFDEYIALKPLAMQKLSEMLPELLQGMEMMPPQIFRVIPPSKKYVLAGLKKERSILARNKKPDDPGEMGGFYIDSMKAMWLTELSADFGIGRVWRHERVHHDDANDYDGYEEDRPRQERNWERQFHGGRDVYMGKEWYEPFADGQEAQFARRYGRHSIEEDKATVGAMQDHVSTREELQGRAKEKTLLRAKMEEMDRYYYLLSLGRWDEQARSDLNSGVIEKRGREYWDEREKDGDFDKPECKTLEGYFAFDTFMANQNAALKKLREDGKNEVVIDIYRIATVGKQDGEKYHPEAISFYEKLQSTEQHNPYNLRFYESLQAACKTHSRAEKAFDTNAVLVPVLERRLKLLPEIDHQPSYYSELIGIYRSNGNQEEASELLAKAIQFYPHDLTLQRQEIDYLQLSDKQKAVEHAEKLYTTSKMSEDRRRLATMYAKAGKYADVVTLYEPHFADDMKSFISVLHAEGQNESIHKTCATYLSQNLEADKALEAYTAFVAAHGKEDDVKALVRLCKGIPNDAPEKAKFMLRLGRFYADKEMFDDAEKTYAEVAKQHPEEDDAAVALVIFHRSRARELSKKQSERAMEHAQKAEAFLKKRFLDDQTIERGWEYYLSAEAIGKENKTAALKLVCGSEKCKKQYENLVEGREYIRVAQFSSRFTFGDISRFEAMQRELQEQNEKDD